MTSGRNGDDAEGADAEGQEPKKLERSPEGRFVIRSSSHPPEEHTASIDFSGVHDRPVERPATSDRVVFERRDPTPAGRKSTPAERPRKRRALQDAAHQAELRARCDTPRALPGERPSQRPTRPGTVVMASLPVPRPAPLSIPEPDAAERAGVDEVTRRVRRPNSHPPPQPWSWAQRAVILAVAVVATAALVLALSR